MPKLDLKSDLEQIQEPDRESEPNSESEPDRESEPENSKPMSSVKQELQLNRPKLGVSTFLWCSSMTNETLPLLDRIKSLGYDSVEIALAEPSALDPVRVRARCIELGLEVTVCGAFGPPRDLSHEDKKVRQVALDYISACLEFCAAVEAPFFAGPLYAEVGKARMLPLKERQAEWQRSVEGVRQACEIAESYGRKIAVEPLNRFETDMLNSVDQVVRFIDQVAHPAACISLDTFHMNIEETDLLQALKLAGSRLIHLQVADNHRGVPGTGSFNWDLLGKALTQIAYEGPIVLESFTTEDPAMAEAVFFWKKFAPSQDQFASDGLSFLRSWLLNHYR